MGIRAYSYNDEYLTIEHIKQIESVRNKWTNPFIYYKSIKLIASQCKSCKEIHLVLALEDSDGDCYFLLPQHCDMCNTCLTTYMMGRSKDITMKLIKKYGKPVQDELDLIQIGINFKNINKANYQI